MVNASGVAFVIAILNFYLLLSVILRHFPSTGQTHGTMRLSPRQLLFVRSSTDVGVTNTGESESQDDSIIDEDRHPGHLVIK